MGFQKASGKLVVEYLEKFPDYPSLTLAKAIYKDHPAVFTDVDAVRSVIRYHRAATGVPNAKSLKDKRFVGTGRIPLPLEETEDYKPYILNKKNNNIGVISDVHIPNHRNKPIGMAYDWFEEKGINTLIINGDLMDNTPFTKFLVSPKLRDAKAHLTKGEYFLEATRDRFPDAKIIWLEGNHDFWYKQYLMRKAPEIYGDPYYDLTERLHLEEYKIEFLQQERYLMAGKLAVCHGHHLIKGIFSPVNAARGVYLRAKVPTLIGHVHCTSEHTEPNLHWDIATTWSTGCLCTLTPDYSPMGGKVNHGVAHISTEPNGDFHVTNRRIDKGKWL